MFIRYRMLSSGTLTHLKADIVKIIKGQITSVNDFGVGCDKTNTLVYGTYPSGIYTEQNAGSYTFSKRHGQYTTETNYFRLVWSATNLGQIVLGKNYNSGTDTISDSATGQPLRSAWNTYVNANFSSINDAAGNYRRGLMYGNSAPILTGDVLQLQGNGYWVNHDTSLYGYSFRFPNNIVVTGVSGGGNPTTVTLNKTTQRVIGINLSGSTGDFKPSFSGWRTGNLDVGPVTYNSALSNTTTIDIVINDKMFFIGSIADNVGYGIFDVTKNGVTRVYTYSMHMAMINVLNPLNSTTLPYTYKVSTTSYGSVSNGMLLGETPVRVNQADTNTVMVVENPTFVQTEESGYAQSSVFGLYKIPTNMYVNGSVYKDSSDVYRVVYNNFAIYTE